MSDVRPPGLNLKFRPGTTITLTITGWPAGSLSGRTFQALLGADALALSINGDVMTLVIDNTITDNYPTQVTNFVLNEEIDGTFEPMIIGRWTPSNSPRETISPSGTYQVTVGAAAVTINVSSVQASLIAHTRSDARSPLFQPLARFRAEAERARQAGRATVVAFIGDSLTESYEPTKRGLRWIDRLPARLNGLPGKSHYVPITTNALSTTTATDWPGDQPPWTYSGTVTGSVLYGADLHAATFAISAFAELAYFGDLVNVVYVRTPDGPSAAAVTIDGASVGTINANGSELPGQIAAFGIAGDYGAHTLRVTATGAPLVLEGAVVHDGTRFGFGVPFDMIHTYAFGHAGFQTSHFTGNANWPKSVAALAKATGTTSYMPLIGIALGANDIGAGVTSAAYKANLVTIMEAVDTAFAAVPLDERPGFLLILMPGLASYQVAAWEAAEAFGAARCAVLDLGARLPESGADWDIFDAGNGHPNDEGQLWIADQIAEAIDPAGRRAPPTMSVGGPIIEATDEPTARSSWAASFGFTNGQPYDTTSADSTVRERRHRVWLEKGDYVARVRYEQLTTTGGTIEALLGHTSMGSVATTGTTGTIGETQLATTVTVDSPGWYPITIRKTAASSAALRFMRLHLRKTA